MAERNEPDVSLNEDHGPDEDPERDEALDPDEEVFEVEVNPDDEQLDVHAHDADEELMR